MARNYLGLLSLATVSSMSMNLLVKGAGTSVVNGIYIAKAPTQIPVGFSRTCDEMGWESLKMWKQLSNQVSPWWKHSDNESYIYYNKGDGQWWIDDPSGAGLYVVLVQPASVSNNMASATPPLIGWKLLRGAATPAPSVETIASCDTPSL